MDELRMWAPIIVSMAALITTWLVNTRSARRSEMVELESKLAAHATDLRELDGRTSKLESSVGHLPTKEQVHKLEVNTVELRGDVKALAETTKGVASTASRLEGYLLSAEKRAMAGS